MTAQWTIDDNGGETWLVAPHGVYYSLTGLGIDDEGDAAALVADVRAARLADDMAAVAHHLDAGHKESGGKWWSVRGTWYEDLGELSPGEVAALHRARQRDDR